MAHNYLRGTRNGSDMNGRPHAHPSKRGPQLADLVRDLALPDACRWVLDVGCGDGDDVRWLQHAGFDAVGIDIREEALAAAAALTPPHVEVTWMLGAATALPIADDSCVMVTDRGCLHHVDTHDQHRYAMEAARVLVPGGVWIIRDVVGHHHHGAETSAASLAQLASGASLHVDQCELVDADSGHQWICAVLRRV